MMKDYNAFCAGAPGRNFLRLQSFFILLLFLVLGVIPAYAQTAIIGTGTVTTAGSGSDPIDGYYSSNHYQVVYTAAELTAAGVPAGASLTGLGFSIIEDYGGGNLNNYTIGMAHTAATNSASHNSAALTVVRNASAYNPTVTAAGVFDMLAFNNNFTWNGTSNILVDICTGPGNLFSSPYGGVRVTTLANGSRFVRADSGSQCAVPTATVNGNKPNIQFSYIGTSPYLSATALTAFGSTCINTTAGPNSFTLSGGNLTGDVSVGPLSGFSFSETATGTYTSSLTLSPASGSLAKTIYVKFTPTATSYTGSIAITSSGASTANVAASGTGVNTPPAISAAGTAGSITLSGAVITGATISTTGCSAITAYGIEYSTTAAFAGGTGTQVAGAGFSGTAGGTFSATLSGLSAGTVYYFRAYAVNGGGTVYAATPGTFTTSKVEPTNQASAFAAGTATVANIPLTWTAATGAVTPTGYLIKANTSSVFTDPVDGNDPGTGTLALGTGETFYKTTLTAQTFTSGTAGTMYYFKNYTYTNSGTQINFKTDNAPVLYHATKPAAATATAVNEGITGGTVNWTLPATYSAANHTVLVFVKAASAITAGTPSAAPSGYTANAVFGSGTAYQNDAAAYCVYKGDGTAVTITGLAAGVTYNIMVVTAVDAANSNGSHSYSATAAASLYTGYCIPSSTATTYYIANFTTTGGVANINKTSTFTTGGYADYSATSSASIAQGQSLGFKVTPDNGGQTYGINVWVDWNNDYAFADSEKVYASGAFVISASSSFLVPADAVPGNHRMRVRISYAPNNPTPCGQHSGETEDYTLNVIPLCTASITSVTGAVRCGGGTVSLSAVGVNAAEYRWYAAATGGSPLYASAAPTWETTVASGTTYYVAAYNGTCESDARMAVSVTVNPLPATVTITAPGTSICSGEVQALTASGGSTQGSVVLREDFNGAVAGWVTTNNSTGGTPENANWFLYESTADFHSNDYSDFISSDSDLQGLGGITETLLTSPAFSLEGFSDAALTFYHYFRDSSSDAARVQIKVGDAAWANLKVYNQNSVDVGSATAFALETIDLSAYAGNTSVKIRFKYNAEYGYYWNLDNVVVKGTQAGKFTWAANTANSLFTDAAGTVPYTGQQATTVYGKPSATTVYTATSTNNAGCTSMATATVTVNDKTWSGIVSNDWNTAGNWCGGQVPAINDPVVIPVTANQPVITGSIAAKAGALTIKTGAVLKLASGSSLTVNDAIVIEADALNASGNAIPGLVIENNASLVQVAATANTGLGTALVHRNSSSLLRQDYTLWSSPVAAQNLQAFSPETLAGRFYTYNTTSNNYTALAPSGSFNPAQGYLIRMPNSGLGANGYPTGTTSSPAAYQAGNATMVYNGKFTGRLNNGAVPFAAVTAGSGYNALGNPYASPISIASFFEANSGRTDGIIYFWRKTNGSEASAYCTINSEGDYSGNLQPGDSNPDGFIQAGQGFIVKALASPLTFNNTMRSASNANDGSFFRTGATPESHRIWLNLNKGAVPVAQMLVAYKSSATQGVDTGIDAPFINDVATGLNSLLDGAAYAIQGRPLPFSSQDIVPLQFKAGVAGSYSISLDHADGMFLGSQEVFLKDNLAGVVHNIKTGPYSFTAEAGSSDTRFEIVYTDSALSTDVPVLNAESVIIYKQENLLHITSAKAQIATISIYDTRGRLVYEKKGINANETTVSGLQVAQQVLVVQVTTIENVKVSKKVIY
jgi:hypothetical protein